MEGEERFQLVDREGNPVGAATRSECHGNPQLIHAVVHLQVRDGRGRLFLQKRSPGKDLYPGRWDTAVGGHVRAGEPVAAALAREAREELGIRTISRRPAGSRPAARGAEARLLFTYLHRSAVETEFVHTFGWTSEGPFRLNPEEVAEGRFFSRPEIEERLGRAFFTPNFEEEYGRLLACGFIE